MPELTCQKCGHEWTYSGESEHYCTCPRCRTSVKVREQVTAQDTGTAGSDEDQALQPPDPDLRESVEELRSRVEAVTTAHAESTGDLARRADNVEDRADELEERADEIEAAAEEIAGVVEELIEAWGGEVDWESEALAEADPDPAEPSVTVPEAVRNADVEV